MRFMNARKIISLLVLCAFVLSMVAVSVGAEELAPFPSSTPVKKLGKIKVGVWYFGYEGDVKNNVWTKWINENCPVDVEFVPQDRITDETKVIPAIFSAGNAPDYVHVYMGKIIRDLYAKKQIKVLDDIVSKYSVEYKAMLKKYPGADVASRADDGKMVSFVRAEEPALTEVALIRADWLEKKGLKMPETIDDFFNVAKAFTTGDPDGNGKKDTYGFHLGGLGRNFLANAFGYNDLDYKKFRPYIVSDGKLTLPWGNIQNHVNFMKKMNQAGIVMGAPADDVDGSKAGKAFQEGKLGILFANRDLTGLPNSGQDTFTKFREKMGNKVKLAVLKMPKTNAGSFGYGVNKCFGTVAVLNAKSTKAELVMKYQDFMTTEKVAKFLKFGAEGRHYRIRPDGTGLDLIDNAVTEAETGKKRALMQDYQHNTCGMLPLKDCDGQGRIKLDQPFGKELYGLMNQAKAVKGKEPIYIKSDYVLFKDSKMNKQETEVTKKIREYYNKCITTASYTPEQMIKDMQKAWKDGGGEAIFKYYADWYKASKKSIITSEHTNNLEVAKFPELK